MSKFSKLIVVALLTFIVGSLAVVSWIYFHRWIHPPTVGKITRWDKIAFRDIDRATSSVGVQRLRDTALAPGEIEVRIWRESGSPQLEGLLISRWGPLTSARLIQVLHGFPLSNTVIREIPEPVSGWDVFWEKLTQQGLLTLPNFPEESCENTGRLDGGRYVVEVLQDHVYRNYTYGEEDAVCLESKHLDAIRDIVGQEFPSDGKCTANEWLECTSLRLERQKRQAE